jgi:hypothetical protein
MKDDKMLTKIIKSILEGYGIDQKMVDKVKSVVDNINVEEVGDQVWIDLNLKKVRIIIQKDEEKGEQ